MAARYARGARAWGQDARTGERVLLSELIRDGHTGLPVTRESYEPKHPQETPVEVFDPQVLRRPAPDVDAPQGFFSTTFTWDPGSIADGTIELNDEISLSGAVPGDTVIVYAGVDLEEMLVAGYVSRPGVVAVALLNLTNAPINLASSTWKVVVTPERKLPGRTTRSADFIWTTLHDGVVAVETIEVPDASVGDAVLVYPAQDLFGVLVTGYVAAADTVEVVALNATGGQVGLVADRPFPLWGVLTIPQTVGVTSLGSRTLFGQSSLGVTTFTWDPGSVADGAVTSTTVSVTGASVGDGVVVYPGTDLSSLTACGYVSAADTVEVVIGNLTGAAVDLASGTWAVEVLEQ